jgi:2,4-diaminopentanoate dehydrogenase
MATPVRAVQYGIGPIGAAIARLAHDRGIQIVGAIDVDPAKVGKDAGEIMGLGKPLGVRVSSNPEAVLGGTSPDIVFHSTASSLQKVAGQLTDILQAGRNVVSTCEELAYPRVHNPELGAELHQVARASGVTILGTGINPGFLMDTLPIVLSGVCQTVSRVEVHRVVDASLRRLPLQKKVGAGLSVEEFAKLVAAGTVRHVGLKESIYLIADALGWELDRTTESTEPFVAEEDVCSQYFAVKKGMVAGVKQHGAGFVGGEERICLRLAMALGAPDPRDEVHIVGVPEIRSVVQGGVHGDLATAAIVVNSARRVIDAAPGLITMKDLPPVCFRQY